MARYQSPFSVDYRKPIIIDSKDPRARFDNIGRYKTRCGSQVIVANNLTNPLSITPVIPRMPAIYTDINGAYTSIAMTKSGNDYYTVASGTYLTFQKWSSNDTLSWQKTSSVNPASYFINAVTDYADNLIYVQNSSTGRIQKISPSGSMVWSKTIASYWSINVDTDQNNNVYVISQSYNSSSLNLIKFDSSGSVTWQKSYSLAADYNSVNISVVPDGSAIYVAWGDIYNSGKYNVVKHLANGSIDWAKTFSISGTSLSYLNPHLKGASSNGVWVHATDGGKIVVNKVSSTGTNSICYLGPSQMPGGEEDWSSDVDSNDNNYFFYGYVTTPYGIPTVEKYDSQGNRLLSLTVPLMKNNSGSYTSEPLICNKAVYDGANGFHVAGKANWSGSFGGSFNPFKYKIFTNNSINPPTGSYYLWNIFDTHYSKASGGISSGAGTTLTASISTYSITVSNSSLSISDSGASLSNASDITHSTNNKPQKITV